MAGAGYKLFQTGDVLTAAQVNTYLNEQTVMVFASAAARTSALSGVLAEGMVSYLQDTNAVEVYNGSAWTAVGGGGLSSPLTTKGDVWGYSTTNARIPVGSNGTVLTADSAETLGVKWAAPAAASYTWTSYTPTVSSTSGTITSTTTSGKYIQIGKMVTAIAKVTITNAGSGTNTLTVSIPITAVSGNYPISGQEISATGKGLAGSVDTATSSTSAYMRFYDFTTCIATNNVIVFSITYEVA